MAEKRLEPGTCDLCQGEIPAEQWYTTKGKPRLYCSRDCRNSANSRAGSEIRSKKARQRVARDQWQNPAQLNPPNRAKIAAGVRQARQREVEAGTWRNPALSAEARAKLSRPRKHSGPLHRAIEKLGQGLTMADLSQTEAAPYRAYRARLRAARRGEINARNRQRYRARRTAMSEAEKEAQRAKWRAQREKTAQRGPNPRLVAARQATGLSQATLAGKVGVTQMAVSRWESSSVVPRQAEIRRHLAAVLQIEEDELWTTQ